jgi:ribonuclease VapC
VLNYGDCLAYGVAMAEREPLLFKGDDFARTDVDVVSYK